MWDNSGYRSNAPAGGFLSSPGGPPGSKFDSPNVGDKKISRNRLQNIVPCTCSLLRSAVQSGDRFLIGDIEVHQITIVGMISSVNQTSTYLDYALDDHTGDLLMVKQFADIEQEDQTARVEIGKYVRVTGSLRVFQNKQSLTAFKLKILTNLNEIAFHMLEVIRAHSGLSKGSSFSADKGGLFQPAQDGFDDIGIIGLTKVQAQVQQVITRSQEDRGISVSNIMISLKGVSENSIRDALEFLSSEGHIYSTIDENHFKSTDAM